MARSKWVPREFMEHILALCTVENEEALRVSMDYGARIGDVLRMPTSAARSGRWNYREQKTGKRRRVRLSERHRARLLSFAGKVYCFEHRTDWTRPRTRQAVYKDLRRAAEAFRVKGVSPHTERKIYSVEQYKKAGGDLRKVQRLLNHSSEAVTVLYALADELSAAKVTKR
jgi:integrase